jgi:hypothetical protein
MSVPNIDVSAWVPPIMMKDLKRVVTARKENNDTHLVIFIPLEDFGSMMVDIQQQMVMRGMGYMPFTPTVLGIPVAGHEKQFVAVMSRPHGTHDCPILFDISNGEHEVI